MNLCSYKEQWFVSYNTSDTVKVDREISYTVSVKMSYCVTAMQSLKLKVMKTLMIDEPFGKTCYTILEKNGLFASVYKKVLASTEW